MEEDLKKSINRVVFIIMMHEEIDAILEKEQFILDEENSKRYESILQFHIKKTDSLEVIMVKFQKDPFHQTSVFGTELSFFGTSVSISTYNPDLIINMGYAGHTGVDGILSLGTVCVANTIAKFHRRQMIVDFARNTNEGNYPLKTPENLIRSLKFTPVYVGTSNSFVEFDDIAFKLGIHLVEMELASIAKACNYFNKTLIGIKIVSDNTEPQENRDATFKDSLTNLKQTFHRTFSELSSFLKDKKLDDL